MLVPLQGDSAWGPRPSRLAAYVQVCFSVFFSQSLKGRIRDLLDVLCANKNSTVLKARLLEAALQFPVRLSDNRLPSLRTLSKLSRGPVKLFSLPNESPVEQAGW